MGTERKKIEWFQDARLGMFIHWGLYSIPGRGEWVMYRERIPNDEYAKLADQFNPVLFSPEEWVAAAKKAGMKYAVLTTCHHDGFALFDSEYDDFNSVKTASGRDFAAEFAAACRKHGIGIGFYYSLGNWRYGIMKESDSPEGAEKMRELSHNQVKELMKNYGPVDILWYDGGWCYPSTMDDTQEDVRKFWKADELNKSIRKLQPDILINNRSGAPEDFGTPEGFVPRGGERPWEACLTMSFDENSGWGYWRRNAHRKTPCQIISLIVNAVSAGGNVLLNVSPDPDGKIPGWQNERLEVIGRWVHDNEEAVYGVKRTDACRDINGIQGNSAGVLSEKGDALYFYILEWPGTEIIIPVMKKKAKRAVLLKTGQELDVSTDSHGRFIIKGLPADSVDPCCSVVRIDVS